MFGKGLGKSLRPSLEGRDGPGGTSRPAGERDEDAASASLAGVWSPNVLEVDLSRVRKAVAGQVCLSTAGKRVWWWPGPSCPAELGRRGGRERGMLEVLGSGGEGAPFGLSTAFRECLPSAFVFCIKGKKEGVESV